MFVEFENATQRCSWVKVFGEGVKAVLLEDSIVWANWRDGDGATGSTAVAWPALVSLKTHICANVVIASMCPFLY